MRWFKHYSDNYRGRSIEELYQELGHTGIACYFLITELCAEKLDSRALKKAEKGVCKIVFSTNFVRRNLRISQTKLEVFLRFCSGLGLFRHKISEKELEIDYPILLDLLDSDHKRARSRRDTDATRSRLDIERDRDIEREYISHNSHTEQNPQPVENSKKPKKSKRASLPKPVGFGETDFEILYSQFPRKEGKSRGRKMFARDVKDEADLEAFKKALKNFVDEMKRDGRERRYIKRFDSWMSEWRDWVDFEATKKLSPVDEWLEMHRDEPDI